MRTTFQSLHLLALTSAIALGLAGCGDERSIALTPKPDPGAKPGETIPVEPNQGPQRNHDGNVPLPAATTPTTPGERNSPGAPVPFTPTPSPSPVEGPLVVPAAKESV